VLQLTSNINLGYKLQINFWYIIFNKVFEQLLAFLFFFLKLQRFCRSDPQNIEKFPTFEINTHYSWGLYQILFRDIKNIWPFDTINLRRLLSNFWHFQFFMKSFRFFFYFWPFNFYLQKHANAKREVKTKIPFAGIFFNLL
jgi:hypothetical protein